MKDPIDRILAVEKRIKNLAGRHNTSEVRKYTLNIIDFSEQVQNITPACGTNQYYWVHEVFAEGKGGTVTFQDLTNESSMKVGYNFDGTHSGIENRRSNSLGNNFAGLSENDYIIVSGGEPTGNIEQDVFGKPLAISLAGKGGLKAFTVDTAGVDHEIGDVITMTGNGVEIEVTEVGENGEFIDGTITAIGSEVVVGETSGMDSTTGVGTNLIIMPTAIIPYINSGNGKLKIKVWASLETL